MSSQVFANPYPRGTAKHTAVEVLKDLHWHCAKCELPGSQPAKMLQGLRQDGWQFEMTGHNWESRRHCATCDATTSHRRLRSLERQDVTQSRSGMSSKVRERVRSYYDGIDEMLGYRPTGRPIEIDHRIPQIRWTENEAVIPDSLSNAEIEERFMLLTRENNLLKSRSCERCKKTGERQPFLNIQFFYRGSSRWDDKLGCVGCGWYNPREWRRALNERLLTPT